jgi:hypothetical protein
VKRFSAGSFRRILGKYVPGNLPVLCRKLNFASQLNPNRITVEQFQSGQPEPEKQIWKSFLALLF